MKKQIQIGVVGNAKSTATGFINAWKSVDRGEKVEVEQRLDFENLETFLKTLTSGRWVFLTISLMPYRQYDSPFWLKSLLLLGV